MPQLRHRIYQEIAMNRFKVLYRKKKNARKKTNWNDFVAVQMDGLCIECATNVWKCVAKKQTIRFGLTWNESGLRIHRLKIFVELIFYSYTKKNTHKTILARLEILCAVIIIRHVFDVFECDLNGILNCHRNVCAFFTEIFWPKSVTLNEIGIHSNATSFKRLNELATIKCRQYG